MRAAVPALAAALIVQAPAWAEGPPATRPTRDVDVTYRLLPPAQPEAQATPIEERMRWSVASGLLRVDPPTPGLHMVVDYGARRVSMVQDRERQVFTVDGTGAGLPGEGGGSYVRRDDARVAGIDCTDWTTTDSTGHPATLCLTPDGVMLRAVAGDLVLLQATAVSYAPQDAALFAVPADYARVQPPAAPTTTPAPGR